jgi:hypothetical protein
LTGQNPMQSDSMTHESEIDFTAFPFQFRSECGLFHRYPNAC